MTADLLTSDPDYRVPLRDVERTLARQMKALQGPGAAPVQRARMANLVIFCNSLETRRRRSTRRFPRSRRSTRRG